MSHDTMKGDFDIYERIYSSHWFLTSYNGIGFVYDFPRMGGGRFITKAVYVMENGMCRYIFDKSEFEQAARFTSHRLVSDDRWRLGIYRKIDYYTKRYFTMGEKLRKTSLARFSDRHLASLIEKIVPLQHYHQVWSVLANGVVLDGRNHFSNCIREELRSMLGNPVDFDEFWSLLTQVTRMSLRQKKDYALAKLATQSSHLTPSKVKARLKRLHEHYCFLDYNNAGPAASLEQFSAEYAAAKESNAHLHLPEELKTLRKKQMDVMRRLRLNKRGRFLVQLAQGVIWQKGFRKDMQYHGFYCYEHLFRELASRRALSDWSLLTFLFPWEISAFILTNTPTVSELQERRSYSCFVVTRTSKEVKVGEDARSFVRSLRLLENFSALTEVSGQCAFAGNVSGIVKIIQVPADIPKMNVGDVLVSQATSPDLLPAMKKAGAIVTNTGGLICHAAITSRELKIPCVVGTGKAA